MNLKNILPKGGPAIDEVDKYIAKYNDDFIVIKCGGSVLLDEILFNQLIEDISKRFQKKVGPLPVIKEPNPALIRLTNKQKIN